MKRGSILCLLMAVLLWMGLAGCAAGEARSLYIGDIITLRLDGRVLTEDTIRQAFEGFDITSLEKTAEGFDLSLRTFETGQHTVLLGDKEIILDVRSTLEDIEREDVFEGSQDVLAAGRSFPWRILLYGAAGVFVLSGGGLLIGSIMKRRRARPETAYARFQRRCALLSPEDEGYFVDLTFYFKEYIESMVARRVIGDTSTEIIQALSPVKAAAPLLPDIQAWLLQCDRMKFSGAAVSLAEKQSHAGRLQALAEKLEKYRCEINEEMK